MNNKPMPKAHLPITSFKKALALFLGALLAVTGCSCADMGDISADLTSADAPETDTSAQTAEDTAEDTTAAATEAQTTSPAAVGMSIDGKNIMFVGNSFTYYGNCTIKGTENTSGGNSYFKLVAKSFGDSVKVTNFTYGDHQLSSSSKGLYEKMLSLHPNYHNNPAGNPVDEFYNQDFVVLQQSGNDHSNTYAACKAIMRLFGDNTRFIYYVTTYAVNKNMTKYNIQAGELLRKNDDGLYLPLGQLCCDLWNGKVKVAESALSYNKFSFVVNRTEKDGYHPNYLTGYLTALMTYCLITGRSAVGADYSFVRKTMEHYTYGSTNYDKILSSDADMRGIQELVDAYIKKFNP